MTKNKVQIVLLLFLLLGTHILAGQAVPQSKSDKYLDIIEGFDVYGNAVKTVLNNYLEDVSIDLLIKNSIDGLMLQLDPYSEYYMEEISNELNIITNGRYFGFGFGFRIVNDRVVLTHVRGNTPADIAGLKIGDVVYSINSKVVKTLSETEDVFEKIKDEIAHLQIIRPGKTDTLNITLKKDTIDVQAISYRNILENNIGYIKLESFTSKAYSEFEHSFFSMQHQAPLAGLIIDLRGNTGGILQEALKILNMFVPQNAILLTTKGRYDEIVYRAKSRPVDTLLPLAVIIDGESASASEIVAGCLQDLDRAVILGNNSFGKGLVQEIFGLSNDRFLKLTTAKYYTPSGRCIQKIDYSKNKTGNLAQLDTTDSVQTFHTTSGRDVLEQNGIKPDIAVPQDTMKNQYAKILVNSYLVFDFINYWITTNASSKLPSDFKVTDSIYNSILDYATDLKNAVKIPIFATLDSLVKYESSEKSKEILNTTIENLLIEYRNNLLAHDCKSELSRYLEHSIRFRIMNETDFIKYVLIKDKATKEAIKMLLTSND